MGQVNWKTPQQVADEALANWRASANAPAFKTKIALARAGHMGQVRQAINRLGQDDDLRLMWENTHTLKRESLLMTYLADELGLTDEEQDALFDQAQAIPE